MQLTCLASVAVFRFTDCLSSPVCVFSLCVSQAVLAAVTLQPCSSLAQLTHNQNSNFTQQASLSVFSLCVSSQAVLAAVTQAETLQPCSLLAPACCCWSFLLSTTTPCQAVLAAVSQAPCSVLAQLSYDNRYDSENSHFS